MRKQERFSANNEAYEVDKVVEDGKSSNTDGDFSVEREDEKESSREDEFRLMVLDLLKQTEELQSKVVLEGCTDMNLIEVEVLGDFEAELNQNEEGNKRYETISNTSQRLMDVMSMNIEKIRESSVGINEQLQKYSEQSVVKQEIESEVSVLNQEKEDLELEKIKVEEDEGEKSIFYKLAKKVRVVGDPLKPLDSRKVGLGVSIRMKEQTRSEITERQGRISKDIEKKIREVSSELVLFLKHIKEAKKSPPEVGKKIQGDAELSTDNFVFLHCTEHPPVSGEEGLEIVTTGDVVNLSGRYTIHATMNHPVFSHIEGSWDKKPILLLMPSGEVLKKNGDPLEASVVDTFWFGKIEIPYGSVILLEDNVDGFIIEKGTKDKYKVIVSDNPRAESAQIIEKMGYSKIGGIGDPPEDYDGEGELHDSGMMLDMKKMNKLFKRYHGFATSTHSDSPLMMIEAGSSNMLLGVAEYYIEDRKAKLENILFQFSYFLGALDVAEERYDNKVYQNIESAYKEKFIEPFFEFMNREDIVKIMKKICKSKVTEKELEGMGYKVDFDSIYSDNSAHAIQRRVIDLTESIKKYISDRPEVFDVVSKKQIATFNKMITKK